MLFPLYVLNPRQRLPVVTLLIIAINIAITAWTTSLGEPNMSILAAKHGFVPARLTHLGQPQNINVPIQAINIFGWRGFKQVHPVSTNPRDVYLTFLTAMFLHGSWGHLLMNMWMLWLFGANIEDRLGHGVFLMFYAIGGVLATLTFWLSDPGGLLPMIGASGAIAAVLGAYAVTFPTTKVRTLVFLIFIVFVDMPALLLLGIWFLLQVTSGMMGLWGMPLQPVAFWAHIGGFVAGMILMPLLSFGSSPPGLDWRKEAHDLFQFHDPRFGDHLNSDKRFDDRRRREGNGERAK
ncbi:MAG TPA: rhomboid family intramembrane serine protease [Lacipirellulaceae bacterium]|nr:rhomboid family intramembrane serine protease [Lacipirellulaceae bacterium]